MSAMRLVDCVFNLRLGQTKDYKTGSHWLPSWHSVFRAGIWEVDLAKTPRSGTTTAAHWSSSKDDKSNVEDKVFPLQVCDNH